MIDRIESGVDTDLVSEDNFDAFDNTSNEPTTKSTPFTDLKSELSKAVVKPPITLAIPGRPNVSIKYDTNIDADLLQAWQKRCTRRVRGQDETNAFMFSVIIIANKAEVLIFNGEEQYGENGKPVNFRNPELAQMLGVMSTSHSEIVRALFGFDGHILAQSQEVLVAAGYDPEVTFEGEDDPTRRS